MAQDQYYYIFSLASLTAVTFILHAIRGRITLGVFFGLTGGYAILLWQLLQMGWWVKFGGMHFNAGTTLLIPSILLGSLLVFAYDGLRTSRSYIVTITMACIGAWLFSAFRERLARYVPLPYLIVLSNREHLSIILSLLAAHLAGLITYLSIGKNKYHFGFPAGLLCGVEVWLFAYSMLNFGVVAGWNNVKNDAIPFMLSSLPAALMINAYAYIMAKRGMVMPMRSMKNLLAIWRPSEPDLPGTEDSITNREKVISELRLLNQQLAVSSQLMDYHLAHATYGIVVTDINGKIQHANAPAKMLFENIGIDCKEFSALSEALLKRKTEFHDLLKGCAGKRVDVVDRDGGKRWYEIIATPLKGGDSQANTGYYILIVEVTGRVNKESKKYLSKRIEDLNQTGQVLTHDFSNLLMGVGAQLRRIRGRTSDMVAIDAIDGAHAALGHAREMLVQIGAGSQFGTPRLHRENIADLIRRAIAISKGAADEVKVKIEFECSETHFVDVDSGQLTRVLTNLIKNATRSSHINGEILISIKANGNGKEIIIADEGVGIAEADLERVFEPGFSTKGDGKGGLGLAISYLMVDAHGGHLDIKKNPLGKGICAIIWLPVSIGSELGPDELFAKKIIIATTQPEKYDTFTSELERDNQCCVAEAHNVEEVIALLSDENGWDILFLDENMDMEKIAASGCFIPEIRRC